ncbi:MAG TPA: hypothetical protein VMP11_10530 [Verrucomicrobiae bacterium]|nr:hypothetical protein [Verrucomicrobiae bacterium]
MPATTRIFPHLEVASFAEMPLRSHNLKSVVDAIVVFVRLHQLDPAPVEELLGRQRLVGSQYLEDDPITAPLAVCISEASERLIPPLLPLPLNADLASPLVVVDATEPASVGGLVAVRHRADGLDGRPVVSWIAHGGSFVRPENGGGQEKNSDVGSKN